MNDCTSERCWAEIDLAAISRNAGVARSSVDTHADLMAIVKADGYGHGMVEVSKALRETAQLFGVANLAEAIVLRKAVSQPIVLLGPALPRERTEIARRGFIPSVSSAEEAAAFAQNGGEPIEVNFVVDTGMGRVGALEQVAVRELKALAALSGVRLHSVSTHLPVADEDPEFTRAELKSFRELVAQVRKEIPVPFKVHVLLSAGILGFARDAYDIVRAGLMLYGISPLPQFQKLLQPAMTLKTRVVLVRDLPKDFTISYGRTFRTPRAMRVATLAAGYADGYPRALSGREAGVLIGGKRCAVLGRVTMDLMMADVSGLGDVRVGEEAVLIGRQGSEEILASELAERADTIPWEIFTGIGSRVRRVYQ